MDYTSYTGHTGHTAYVGITARVYAGRGLAREHLAGHTAELTAALGTPPHPGSLNCVCARPLRLCGAAAQGFDAGRRLLWPARLYGTPVLVYRWRGCPLHILEIIAAACLREEFAVQEGETIRLELAAALLAPLTTAERLKWAALWLGREGWYYSAKHTWVKRLEGLGKRLGVNQK